MSSAVLTKKDFQSANEVRWCPGCGDYAILACVQKTLADLGMARENCVFVSGIGCAARFPYYMNTYGLHTIHGRAPGFATGLKLSRPDLNIFLVTGDGDGLSIGANHLLHLFRRNVDLTVLLFNNQIYGLTKGQYSPTSAQGHVAKSTPFGALEEPVNPISFALSANASFVARSIDNDALHLSSVLKQAVAHKGTSLVEIMQTCVVFNDNAFDHLRDKKSREQNVLQMKEKELLLFDQGSKGIALDEETFSPIIVDATIPENQKKILRHEPGQALKAHILAQLKWPEFPTPIGVFCANSRPSLEEQKLAQDEAIKVRESRQLKDLIYSGNIWQV